MKYAMVDGVRVEAMKGQKGECPACGAQVISKCGEKKIWHWSHKSKIECDSWWESETLWHRDWKNHFPEPWQEIPQISETGEKHIADIKTKDGWVLEFQHSAIAPEERRSRDSFYKPLAWVVNSFRLKSGVQLFNYFQRSESVSDGLPAMKLVQPASNRLLRDWSELNSLVFFDFSINKNEGMLWCLTPHKGTGGMRYAFVLSKEAFVKLFKDGSDRHGRKLSKILSEVERRAGLDQQRRKKTYPFI